MKHFIPQRVCAAAAIALAAGLALGAPAYADPVSSNTTTVQMPMPGTAPSTDGPASYEPPKSGMSVQDGAGGIDRDGTNGMIDPDGTTGRITGPSITATPGVRAEAAPLSPRVRS